MKLSSVLFLLAPLLVSCAVVKLPANCNDLYNVNKTRPSGVYTIYPSGSASVQAYCDMDSEGGRWTVFQRRMDGSLNFYTNWAEYKRGFGNAAGEYWLGLDNIQELTRLQNQELMVDMEDFEANKKFALYSSFKVNAESDGYRLNVTGFNNNKGGAGDSLAYHNGQKFTTFDKDQDASSNNCAKSYLGAFWYKDCLQTNPNGVYLWGAITYKNFSGIGVNWSGFKGFDYSLKSFSMKIRPAK